MINQYLTKECPLCKGTGKRISEKLWLDGEDCYNCFATGKVANEEGLEILELVRRIIR